MSQSRKFNRTVLASSLPAIAAASLAMPQVTLGTPPPQSSTVLADNAFDEFGNVFPCGNDDQCFSTGATVCRSGFCYMAKSRVVSVRPNPANAGMLTARRVCIDVPGNLCRWVQEPVSFDPVGSEPTPVLVSDIGPNPVYRDWSADPIDSHGNTVVHISGCWVSNNHDYLIQSIVLGQDENDEAAYSPVLSLPTTPVFGDVAHGSSPPNNAFNLSDITMMVVAFEGDPQGPNIWYKIAPSAGPIDPTHITLVGDLRAQSQAFPFGSYPGPLPGDVCENFCPIDVQPIADIQLVPARASGVEGVDWLPGPGPNDITLFTGGQDVAVEVFIENAATVAGYQFGLDCAYSFDLQGSITPHADQCSGADGGFDPGNCLGVDESRTDYLFDGLGFSLSDCNRVNQCPDGQTGKYICGSYVHGAGAGGPGPFYGATFGFAVSADALGTATVGLSSNPGETLLTTGGFCPFSLNSVANANIIVSQPLRAGDAFDINGTSVSCTGGLTCSITGAECTGVLTCTEGGNPCTSDDDCDLPDDACTDDCGGADASGFCTDGCLGDAICVGGSCYVPKGRFVSVQPIPANAGLLTARRVNLDLGAGTVGLLGWVQEPLVLEPTGPGPVPLLVSAIGPDPVFRNWSADPIDSQGRRVVHISGCGVSNNQTYIIQFIQQGADQGEEANFSAPLSLPTTELYGDVSGLAAGSPPDGARGFNDIMEVVFAFQGHQAAPRTWLRIAPSGDVADPTTITLASDVLSAVQGFQGNAYTGLAPLDCP